MSSLTKRPRPHLRVLLVIVSFLSVSCDPGGDEVVIGVVGPLSGPFGQIGRDIRNGATLAAEEVNRRGGIRGKQVRIAFRDDSDRSGLVRSLRDLVEREEPVAIIGPETIGPLRSKNNPIARSGISALTIGAAAGSISENPSLFRMSPSNRDQAKVVAGWITKTRGMNKVAIVAASDEWGADGARELRAELRSSAAEVVASSTIERESFDPGPVVESMRSSGASALVLWVRPEQAAQIASAVRRTDWRPQIVGSDALLESKFRSLAGDASDDVVFVAPKVAEEKWLGRDLREWFLDYHRRFTILPISDQRTLVADLPFNAVTSYDAVNLIVDAIARADSEEPASVNAELQKTKGFKGVMRAYTFDRSGESYSPGDLSMARFFNLAMLYDVGDQVDVERQIAFYKIQVSAYYVPDRYLDTDAGEQLVERVLEDVLTNPEQVEFFKAYEPPRPPPGPV